MNIFKSILRAIISLVAFYPAWVVLLFLNHDDPFTIQALGGYVMALVSILTGFWLGYYIKRFLYWLRTD